MSNLTNIPLIGEKAPSFSAANQNGDLVKLEDFQSNWFVLYFYPKDNTPGCTVEAKDFSEYSSQFDALRAKIQGVNPESETANLFRNIIYQFNF